ncbi:hypothetical protein GOODEAATRI_026903 [Goodea atripinnis]|uniref:TIAM1 CC-Ex domain-containing protein n=1 Tax=Goodea atripinnis TaxID=208336 RepID=A0ABV0MVG0_9TELE
MIMKGGLWKSVTVNRCGGPCHDRARSTLLNGALERMIRSCDQMEIPGSVYPPSSPRSLWLREEENPDLVVPRGGQAVLMQQQNPCSGDGSEYEDSGIDGVMVEVEHQPRRYKTMSASFSVCSMHGRSVFVGSDSGSSSGGGGASEGVQGVYENFRQELQMSSCQTESLEEAGSALSDEQSTMSSAYQSDLLLSVVQGMVRKAGKLAVKNFLVHKKNKKVESATRRNQTELENWITAIHSACATAVARQHHREDTVRLLRAEIKKLEQKIDMDEKMKKMGEMQLSAVTDTKKRKTILDQIFLWEQNLEQFHMDLFRFRCYLASLQGGELPNPKRLLAFASRPTKLTMGRLGIFSVSSFHALVDILSVLHSDFNKPYLLLNDTCHNVILPCI